MNPDIQCSCGAIHKWYKKYNVCSCGRNLQYATSTSEDEVNRLKEELAKKDKIIQELNEESYFRRSKGTFEAFKY